MMRKIGNTIKGLREKLELTQREMAEKLSISIVHLSKLENSKASPSTDLVEKFEKIFGVDLYVMNWCEQESSKNIPSSLRPIADKLRKLWLNELKS